MVAYMSAVCDTACAVCDKLSISDSQLNHSTGQYDPITTTSISDFYMKLNTDNITKLQLFAKVILHNPNTHTYI